MTHAFAVLKPNDGDLWDRAENKEDYAVFMGSLHLMINRRCKTKPGVKADGPDEIKDMGAGLIRNSHEMAEGLSRPRLQRIKWKSKASETDH